MSYSFETEPVTRWTFAAALCMSALLAPLGACGGGSSQRHGGEGGPGGGNQNGGSAAIGGSADGGGRATSGGSTGDLGQAGADSSGGGANPSTDGGASCSRSDGISRDRATLSADAPFVHPGALSTAADLTRMAAHVAAAEQPWKGSWDLLTKNSHAQLTYVAHPAADICAGGTCTTENYMTLANDAAAAYQLALRYHGSGDAAYAAKAEAILDGWADTLKSFSGDSNLGLRAALYGYQLACAGELLRVDAKWDPGKLQQLLKDVFYPIQSDFLKRHNSACEGNYWANWDLANMAAIIAIGVFTDQRALFNEAVTYFYEGVGQGSIENAIHYLHPDGSGQWQEAGRDQGHATLGPMLLAVICEIAWNQGVDLYAYAGNLFLAGAEYVAAYNLGEERPFVAYTWLSGSAGSCKEGVQKVVSTDSRGNMRAGWQIIVNHYTQRRGIATPYAALYAAATRP